MFSAKPIIVVAQFGVNSVQDAKTLTCCQTSLNIIYLLTQELLKMKLWRLKTYGWEAAVFVRSGASRLICVWITLSFVVYDCLPSDKMNCDCSNIKKGWLYFFPFADWPRILFRSGFKERSQCPIKIFFCQGYFLINFRLLYFSLSVH